MSAELRVTYQGSGANLYAIVRRISDGYAWNGASFETWADGHLGTYAVALTDEGGDVYAADFPNAIGAGSYLVTVYERAGGSPATTDLLLRSYSLYWNGSAASDESDVSLDAYALTTLAAQKEHQRITSNTDDTLLTRLINAVSVAIERVTGRQFKARDRRYWLNFGGQKRLLIPNPPLQSVYRIAYGANNALSIQYAGSAIEARATVYRNPENPDAGGVKLVSYDSTGARTVTDLPFATYASTSVLATQIATASGWTATVQVNIPTANLHPTGGGDAKSTTLNLTYPDWTLDDYSVDYIAGTVEFAPSWRGGPFGWWPDDPCYGRRRFVGGHQSGLVECRTGFETIPEDVALLCREMVKEAWYAGQQNTLLSQYAIGPYQVTFNQQQADRVRERLAPYILDGWVGGSV